MSTSDSCIEGSSKSNNYVSVFEVNDMLQNMSTVNIDVVVVLCANCGKEGAKNICNKCKQVKYCNAVCKKIHKKKHKKDCEEHIRLAAEKHNEELKHAAELHDEKLFKKSPPEAEDCPICFLRLPTLSAGRTYMSCCGKVICSGCICAPVYDNQGNEVANKTCAFCRVPLSTSDEETIERLNKRAEVKDPWAIHKLGVFYAQGTNGYRQDYTKALELWHRSGELGYARAAYASIGYAYEIGEGVEVDYMKANHYYELAAMGGNAIARHNLGIMEENAGNMDRSLKHHMIAVRGGEVDSVNSIKQMYTKGHATKDDYTKALESYQEYLSEIKSVQRDKAAAADEDLRYY